MADLTPISYNGLSYDFSSIRVSLVGGVNAGPLAALKTHLREISASDAVTPTKPRGTHGIPLPSGLGFYTVTSSMTLVHEGWLQLLERLPEGYTAVLFNLILQLRNIGQARPAKIDLVETRIIGVDRTWSSGGSDGLLTKLNLDTRFLLEQGKCLYPREIA